MSKEKKFAAILASVAAESWVKSTQGAKTRDGVVKYKYLQLADILEKLQPILAANNAFLKCAITPENIGVSCICADTGEVMNECTALIPHTEDAQALGSWHTYLRRYLILAMFNIAAEDDDGAATLPKKILPKINWQKAAQAVNSGQYSANDIWAKYPDTPMNERFDFADFCDKQKQPQM